MELLLIYDVEEIIFLIYLFLFVWGKIIKFVYCMFVFENKIIFFFVIIFVIYCVMIGVWYV